MRAGHAPTENTRGMSTSHMTIRSTFLRHRSVVIALIAAVIVGALALPVGAASSDTSARADPASDTSVRTVPGIANSTGFRIRSQPGNGSYQYVAPITLPAGAIPFFGDWDGDGAATPAYFLDGTWTIYSSFVGAPAPAATFTFGAKGDLPVVGDWDGDGRTGIGFVHDGVWNEREVASAGPAQRRFSYGRLPGDRPIAGDWNGDGVDTPGVQRSSSFLLADVAAPTTPSRTITFGRAGDVPVVGDWDGTGSDRIGVVRGQQWYLLSVLRNGAPREQRTITIGSGVPAPFPAPVGASGSACPTARRNRPTVAAPVVPPGPALLGRSMAAETVGLRTAMTNAQRTMLGPEYQRLLAPRVHQPFLDLDADSPIEEVAIRPTTMTIVTLAVGLSMDGYDPGAIGHTRSEAIAELDWLLRSIACQHLSVSPGGWGHNWQSGMWASTAGFGAWLVWGQLSPETRNLVAIMVQDEADYVSRRPAEYWMSRSGVVTPGRVGDSAAEEMAWDAGALEFATQMMPAHPQLDAWRRTATQMAAASYASQADTTDPTLVNGVALSTRLAGFNTTPEGAVVNHGGLSADYTTCARQTWWAVLYGALGRQRVPQAFVLNARRVWLALTQVPYGTTGVIYQPDGTISYPDVADWGRLRYPTYAATDAMAHLVAADVDASGRTDPTPALTWMDRHIAKTTALQARHADGHIYEPGEELYPAPEELGAHLIAYTWAARYADRTLPRTLMTSALIPLP